MAIHSSFKTSNFTPCDAFSHGSYTRQLLECHIIFTPSSTTHLCWQPGTSSSSTWPANYLHNITLLTCLLLLDISDWCDLTWVWQSVNIQEDFTLWQSPSFYIIYILGNLNEKSNSKFGSNFHPDLGKTFYPRAHFFLGSDFLACLEFDEE